MARNLSEDEDLKTSRSALECSENLVIAKGSKAPISKRILVDEESSDPDRGGQKKPGFEDLIQVDDWSKK